jgi:hypothetical protein
LKSSQLVGSGLTDHNELDIQWSEVLMKLKRTENIEEFRLFSGFGYEQSVEFSNYSCLKSGFSPQFFELIDGDGAVSFAAARIRTIPTLRKGLVYISGGPSISRQPTGNAIQTLQMTISALKEELVDKQGQVLIVRLPPSLQLLGGEQVLLNCGFVPCEYARDYRTVMINLEDDEASLRAQMAAKWRTDLRFAEKSGLTIETGTSSIMKQRFLDLFGSMQDRKNFDLHVDPHAFFKMSSQDLGLKILIAQKEGKDAAGHILSFLGDTAVYLFGATNEMGRATKAGYLMNWRAMQLAKHSGFAWYDLGGVDSTTNPGGYRFKTRMGGTEVVAMPYVAVPSGIVGSLIDSMMSFRTYLLGK